ncbi:hypothetical protein EDB89DRAFT_313893 [Lactarius sanguifluus]|nr:hypothetical protein EDB89DRAFT_313893 [Lactarius sanguifluus]
MVLFIVDLAASKVASAVQGSAVAERAGASHAPVPGYARLPGWKKARRILRRGCDHRWDRHCVVFPSGTHWELEPGEWVRVNYILWMLVFFFWMFSLQGRGSLFVDPCTIVTPYITAVYSCVVKLIYTTLLSPCT